MLNNIFKYFSYININLIIKYMCILQFFSFFFKKKKKKRKKIK